MVNLGNINGGTLLAGYAGAYLLAEDMAEDATGGLNLKNWGAGSFGASSAQFLGDELTSRTGMDISSPLAQALAGAGVSLAGDRLDMVPQDWSDPFAAGIHYNVGQQAINQAGLDLASLMGKFDSGSAQSTATVSQSTNTGQSMTHRNTGGSAGNVVDY